MNDDSNAKFGYAPSDWAGESSQRWASQADRLEAQLMPVSDVLFAAAALQPGERILDVGCGRGGTTRQAGECVAPNGSAVGVDISQTLLNEARLIEPERTNVDYVVADAQTHDFDGPLFDVVISRFGVMFFEDSSAAFANLRAATRIGGRLLAAVWQTRDRSELMEAPLLLAVERIKQLGHQVTLPPADGGPFSFGTEPRVRDMLSEAGWSNIGYTTHDVTLYNGGPGTVDDALAVAFTIGPIRALLSDLPSEVEVAVRDALRADFARRHDGIGVKFQGGIAIVSAVNQ